MEGFKRSRTSDIRAVMRGLTQYLILGAGLDTFSYRQPSWARALHIFEIDHPATQDFKRQRLAVAGIVPPANLTFLPVDFETSTLEPALRGSGFAFDSPAFCSWLGVTPCPPTCFLPARSPRCSG